MTPRVWVGCLGCHNNGRLNGLWVSAEDAAKEYDDFDSDKLVAGDHYLMGIAHLQHNPPASETLSPICIKCGAEEFEVFDAEGIVFRHPSYSEFWENAQQIIDLAETDDWDRLGEVMANLHISIADIDEAISYDSDHYAGEFSSTAEFTSEMMENCTDAATQNMTLFGRNLLDWIDPEEVWSYTLKYEYWVANSSEGTVYVWTN